MGIENSKFKIDKSILINDDITPEQHLLELIFYGESRESALKKAENIIKCLLDENSGTSDFIGQLNDVIANNAVGPLTLIAILTKHNENEYSYRAKLFAKIRLDLDPKQKEKKFIFECWQEWQIRPSQYKGKAQFARNMLDKCEHLRSQKKIEDWCRLWEKEHSTG